MSSEVSIRPTSALAAPNFTGLVAMKGDAGARWILRRPLTDSERSSLSSEFREVEQRLKTAGREQACKIVSGMIAGFPGPKQTEAEHDAELKRYEFAVAGYPAWAIIAACGKFMRGEIERDNHRFAPTAAEVSVAVRAEVRDVRLRWFELREVLRAEVQEQISDEERSRNAQRVKNLLNTFKTGGQDAQVQR